MDIYLLIILVVIGGMSTGIIAFALWQKSFELVAGASVAFVMVFGSLAFFNYVPPPPPPVKDEAPAMEVIEMPPLEPEEPPEVVHDDQENQQPEFAPPMQTDVPSMVNVDSFVQPLQPPPPDVPKNSGAITIPVNRGNISSKVSNLFDLKDLDQRPQATLQVSPTYPFEMRRQGMDGQVVVGFIVDSHGEVVDPYVISSTNREFEQAALQAIAKWRFRPGRKNGRAVNTRMQQPVNFNIKNS